MREGLTYESLTHFCQSRRTLEMPDPRPTYAIMLAPEQEARLQQLSACSMASFAVEQRPEGRHRDRSFAGHRRGNPPRRSRASRGVRLTAPLRKELHMSDTTRMKQI